MRVYELDHILGLHYLTQLRNKQISTAEFRQNAYQLGMLLLGEASRNLASCPQSICTPLAEHEGTQVKSPLLIPVLRAGLALLDVALKFFPDAKIGLLGAQRDTVTIEPFIYYQKFPEIRNQQVFILEPMLATGNTLRLSIQKILQFQPLNLGIISIIASQEGIANLSVFESVTLYTAAIDSALDTNKFIVPGLGDFGDRWFGT